MFHIPAHKNTVHPAAQISGAKPRSATLDALLERLLHSLEQDDADAVVEYLGAQIEQIAGVTTH